MKKKNNILFHQIKIHEDSKSIVEIYPGFPEKEEEGLLNLQIDSITQKLYWKKLQDPSISIFESDHRLKGTNFYFVDNRLGMGRSPLHNYKFDLKIEPNTLETVFHIGDGSFGFSMGNGTDKGFIPEIIGMGADENDAGLYFLGKTMSSIESNIPLVIIGGISPQKNRPLIGITDGKYNEYKFLIDKDGILHVKDIKLKDSISLKDILEIIKDQQKTINKLVDRINKIQNNS